jgi:tRNA(Ile)-lysidine synthase
MTEASAAKPDPGAARPLDAAEAAALFQPLLQGLAGALLAVSGGPDSMALLALAARWTGAPPLAAATVDHGLRADSADEARLVADAAAALGIAHRILVWAGEKPTTGLQEAARKARHALLAAEARRLGFVNVVTAHHGDDQAETVLMRLAAGSGMAGLAAMRPRSERGGIILVRPFLALPKARLVATCAALGMPYVDDPSNADPRYGRARARRLGASLAAEGLTPERLRRLADRAARADEALAAAAEAALCRAGLRSDGGRAEVDWAALATEPAEIRLRALAAILRVDVGERPQRLARLEALLAALDGALGTGLRRSSGGNIVTLSPAGRLSVEPAPPRRRGVRG